MSELPQREFRRRTKSALLAKGIGDLEWIFDAAQEHGDDWAMAAIREVVGEWKGLLDQLEQERPKRAFYARRFDSLPVMTAAVQEALL